jgi:hypothetical protein
MNLPVGFKLLLTEGMSLIIYCHFYRYLVNQGCIKPLCDLLTCPDARIVTVSLEGLENILKVGEPEKDLGNSNGINLYARCIDEAEGLEKIENLQTHDNNDIYEKAVKILETYWLEEDEDQNLGPAGDELQSSFAFGGNQSAVPSGGFNFG